MNLEELFLILGYTKEDMNEIINSYPLNCYKESAIYKKVKTIYDYFIAFGYKKEEVIKITKVHPSIYCYEIENIQKKIENIILIGYKKEEIIKMTIKWPHIYGLSKENIKEKIEDMILLGYKKEEVIRMTIALPQIYDLLIETIKEKLNIIIFLGYTKAEAIQITNKFPSIFGLSTETIKEKIEFYDSINLHEMIILNSKQLMQSVDLSYARYMFFKNECKTEIDINNYIKLFYSKKRFEGQYGISNNYLLKKYNYSDSKKYCLNKI